MTGKLCVTRQLKEHHAPLLAAKSQALFNGTIHLLDISFQGVAIESVNLFTTIAYMSKALPTIITYCQQYGSVKAQLDGGLPPRWDGPTKIYSDQTLQGWINSLAGALHILDGDCLIILNPGNFGVVNTDADPSQGVGGYHGTTGKYRYCFVNVTGSNWTIDDRADNYAHVLSHELAEMCVDPNADLSEPEVSDPCDENVGLSWRDYFNADSKYIASSQQWPPPFPYTYFIAPIVKPGHPSDKPAPDSACSYYPTAVNPLPSICPLGTGTASSLNFFARALRRKGRFKYTKMA